MVIVYCCTYCELLRLEFSCDLSLVDLFMYCLLLLIVFVLGCGFSVLCFVADFMIVVLGLFVCLFCCGI